MCSHNKRGDEVAEVREKAEGLCFSRYAGKRLDGEEGGRRLGRSRVADARLLATNGRGAARAMPVLDATVARVALSGQNSGVAQSIQACESDSEVPFEAVQRRKQLACGPCDGGQHETR